MYDHTVTASLVVAGQEQGGRWAVGLHPHGE